METKELIKKIKFALSIDEDSESEYQQNVDEEITDLINAAKRDLEIAGVVITSEYDALITRAIITYCKANYKPDADYDKLKKSFDEQKAQLMSCTQYWRKQA